MVVITAKNVILHLSLESKSKDVENGVNGLLVLTNFKLSFLSNDGEQVNIVSNLKVSQVINMNFVRCYSQNISYQENILLGKNDVTLSNIDRLYQILDKKKRSPIGTHTKISSKIEGIHVICKVSGNCFEMSGLDGYHI